MLIGALVLSALLLAIVMVARRAWGNRGACWVAGFGIPATFATGLCMFWSPVLSLQAVLLLLVAIACLIASASQKVFIKASIAAVCLSYLIEGLYSANRLREQTTLEERYPFELVKDRLAYEKGALTVPNFSEETLASLDGEAGKRGIYRTLCLKKRNRSPVKTA